MSKSIVNYSTGFSNWWHIKHYLGGLWLTITREFRFAGWKEYCAAVQKQEKEFDKQFYHLPTEEELSSQSHKVEVGSIGESKDGKV